MDIFTWMPIIFRFLDLLPKITEALKKRQSVFELLQSLGPDLIPFLQNVGSKMFPGLSDPKQMVQAGALALDMNHVREIQEALNDLVPLDEPLTVDGHYGDKTKAAAKKFQAANGLEADGWIGNDSWTKVEELRKFKKTTKRK